MEQGETFLMRDTMMDFKSIYIGKIVPMREVQILGCDEERISKKIPEKIHNKSFNFTLPLSILP